MYFWVDLYTSATPLISCDGHIENTGIFMAHMVSEKTVVHA